MSVRPPRIFARHSAASPLQALEHEVLQEKMATLSRAGRRLEESIDRLLVFEASAGGDLGREAAAERETLLAAAGEAMWHFVIQREAMGLRNTEQALRAYRVPAAVRARMGMAPRPQKRTPS